MFPIIQDKDFDIISQEFAYFFFFSDTITDNS